MKRLSLLRTLGYYGAAALLGLAAGIASRPAA